MELRNIYIFLIPKNLRSAGELMRCSVDNEAMNASAPYCVSKVSTISGDLKDFF
jgi:hypothetical protein